MLILEEHIFRLGFVVIFCNINATYALVLLENFTCTWNAALKMMSRKVNVARFEMPIDD